LTSGLVFSLLTSWTRLFLSSNQPLSLHPFSNKAINLLRLLPKQPMRGIDLSGSKLRNIGAHLANKLISNNRIAQSPHEQSRALDLDSILNLQQRLVGFEVGLTVAVVVACDMSAYNLYSLVPSSPELLGNQKLTRFPQTVPRILLHIKLQLLLADQTRSLELRHQLDVHALLRRHRSSTVRSPASV
jgi:hypothetical protein